MGIDKARKITTPVDSDAPIVGPQACQHCGACCANPGRPPFRPEEMAEVPLAIQRLVAWFDAHDPERAADATPCYFFNLATRKCLIYEHRPRACRDFKPQGPVCKELRRAFAACLDKFNEDMSNRH